LVEKHFESPVVLFDYPKEIKAFYMKLNEDNKTVAAMDVLFPGIGEIIGGSEREARLDVLKQKMADMHVDEHELWWYLIPENSVLYRMQASDWDWKDLFFS
jgi:asparaginyl-tRNA synthetase